MSPPCSGARALVVPLAVALACAGSSPPAERKAPPPAPATQPAAAEHHRYADMLFSEADPDPAGGAQRPKPGARLQEQIDEVAASGARVTVPGAATGQPAPPPPPRPAATIDVAVPRAHDDSSLSADAVARKVRSAYRRALERCFAGELAAGGPATAVVNVLLVINETGRVVPSHRHGGTSLDDCVGSLVSNWRFDVPRDADGEPTEASFDLTLTFARAPG